MPEDQTLPVPARQRFDVTVDYRLFVRGQHGVDSTTRLGPGDTLRALPLDDGTELRIVRTGGEPEQRWGHQPHPIIEAIADGIRHQRDDWPAWALVIVGIAILVIALVGLLLTGSP